MFDRLRQGLDRHRQHTHMAGLLRQIKNPADSIADSIRLASELPQVWAQSLQLVEQSTVIRHHSAKAVCRPSARLLAIDYTGSISLPSIIQIDRQTAAERVKYRGALERIDGACTMFPDGAIERDMQGWPDSTPPSAVIVRQDQYANSLAFCQMLAKCGIWRMPWLPGREAAAIDWLEQFPV